MSNTKNDIHGRQGIAQELLKHLNKEEKGNRQIDIIDTGEWKQHHKNLWHNPNAQTTDDDEKTPWNIHDITMEE